MRAAVNTGRDIYRECTILRQRGSKLLSKLGFCLIWIYFFDKCKKLNLMLVSEYLTKARFSAKTTCLKNQVKFSIFIPKKDKVPISIMCWWGLTRQEGMRMHSHRKRKWDPINLGPLYLRGTHNAIIGKFNPSAVSEAKLSPFDTKVAFSTKVDFQLLQQHMF